MMPRLLKSIFIILVFAAAAYSQAQMSSGDIKGTVTDSTGAIIPAADVTLTNIDTQVQRRVVTDGQGNFRFFVLLPGSYELKVARSGFATTTRRPINVTVGRTVVVDAQLQPAVVQQA